MINLYNSYPNLVIDNFDDMHYIFNYAQSIIDMECYSLFFSSTKRSVLKPYFITNSEILSGNQKDICNYGCGNTLFEYCIKTSMPYIWDREENNTHHSVPYDINKYGLDHGISFPMHGVNHELGILTISFYSDKEGYIDKINKNFVNLMVLRDILLNHLIAFENRKNKIKLSEKEKEICTWYLSGKTTWEISRIINCSESNINFHFKNIREKFNVTSRSAAIIKALEIGQIKI